MEHAGHACAPYDEEGDDDDRCAGEVLLDRRRPHGPCHVVDPPRREARDDAEGHKEERAYQAVEGGLVERASSRQHGEDGKEARR